LTEELSKALALEPVAQRINDLYQRPRSFFLFFSSSSSFLLFFFRSATCYVNRDDIIADIISQEMTGLIILMTVRRATVLPHANERGLPISFSFQCCSARDRDRWQKLIVRACQISQQGHHRRVRLSATWTRDLARSTSRDSSLRLAPRFLSSGFGQLEICLAN